MRNLIRRALAGLAGALVVGAAVVPAQAAPSSQADDARAEHQRVVEFWTPERVAKAVPRDPVFDDRGLAYLRGVDGKLVPFGHGTPARVQAVAPATSAVLPEPGAAPSPSDLVGPTISALDPSDGATIGGAHNFRATVTDVDGVRSVSFVLSDGSTSQTNRATNLGGNVWGVNYSGFWDGAWTWTVIAKDGAARGGNTSSVTADFTVDTGSGGGGGGGGGGSTDELGASWTGDGLVKKTTGKVLFAIGTSYYVCSASVVPDPTADGAHSYLMTAAHCVYDGGGGGRFASNWMFIPDYDGAAATLTKDGSFCADTLYGCWTADALVIDSGFAGQRRFTSTATLHDFAVVRVGAGGKAMSQLDALGTQAVAFSNGALGDPAWLFGYPAASPYNGTDLVYSKGALGTDPSNGNDTYRVASDQTGGTSGGPWFQAFNSGSGTQMSVNSYGYQGVVALHGPFFNSNTAAVYAAAKPASGNTVVPVP